MVVDENNVLSRFRPDTLEFSDVGQLNCPARSGAQPFSMAVARDQTAWVVYDSGELFRVNSTNAVCSATSYAPNQLGTTTFGMGFALDEMGGDNETLFVAAINTGGTASALDTITIPQLLLTPGPPVVGSPELTGTPDANLWGYFPTIMPPMIAQIDKATGALGTTFHLPTIGGGLQPQAWAFAAWGGDFWIFLWTQGDPSTDVYHFVPATGVFTRAIDNTGRHITGAGVSTCNDGLNG